MYPTTLSPELAGFLARYRMQQQGDEQEMPGDSPDEPEGRGQSAAPMPPSHALGFPPEIGYPDIETQQNRMKIGRLNAGTGNSFEASPAYSALSAPASNFDIPGMSAPSSGPSRLNYFDQMLGFVPQEPPTAQTGSPRAMGPFGAIMQPGWDGQPDLGPPNATSALGGPMGQVPQSAFTPTLRPDAAVAPMPVGQSMTGPAATPQHVSTISNMFGKTLSTMAYPDLGGGQYGTGKTTQRVAGYNPSGEWENAISNGVEEPRGPVTAGMALRDAYEKNLADPRFGHPLFGGGMDPRQAFAQALNSQDLTLKESDAEKNRQLQITLEKMRGEEGKYSRGFQHASDMLKSYFNAVGNGAGPQFERTAQKALGDQWQQQLFNLRPGQPTSVAPPSNFVGPPAPGGIAAKTGGVPGITLSPEEKIVQLFQNSADILPNVFEYGVSGIGLGGAKGPAPIKGTAESFGAPQAAEFLNRVAGANLDPESMTALSEALNRSVGGRQIRSSLISRALADEMAAKLKPNAGPGLLSASGAAFTGPFAMRNAQYPQQVTWGDELPGVTAESPQAGNRLGAGLNTLKSLMYNRGLPQYQATLPGGERIPIDMGGSQVGGPFDLLGAQTQYNQSAAARRPAVMSLLQALTRQQAAQPFGNWTPGR